MRNARPRKPNLQTLQTGSRSLFLFAVEREWSRVGVRAASAAARRDGTLRPERPAGTNNRPAVGHCSCLWLMLCPNRNFHTREHATHTRLVDEPDQLGSPLITDVIPCGVDRGYPVLS